MKRNPWKFVLLCTLLLLSSSCLSCESSNPQGTPDESSALQTTESEASASVRYVIVRPDGADAETIKAASELKTALSALTGEEVTITSDWIGRDTTVENSRAPHEILIGKTNRAESETAYASLCENTKEMLDYTITDDGGHYVIAAAEGYIAEAAAVFLSIIEKEPTAMYKKPQSVNETRTHVFPMQDMTVAGISVSEYQAIVYPAVYDNDNVDPYLKKDLEALSDLIFDSVGVALPLISDQNSEIPDGRVIRVGARADQKILSAGDFSFVLDISENGIIIDAQDIYGDTRGVDLLYETIASCAADGTAAIDASHSVRVENPANKPKIEINAWLYAAEPITTEEQVAEIKECGYTQVLLQREEDELFHKHCKWFAKYELQAIWIDHSFYLHSSDSMDAEAAADLVNANLDPQTYAGCDITWGHLLKDEPSAAAFPALSGAVRAYNERNSEKIAYINLFPSYASAEQLGTDSFQAYVDQFFAAVEGLEHASLDYYPLNTDGIMSGYFSDLQTLSAKASENNIPFGIYIQSVSFAPSKRTPTEDEMRWQTYCCLAFGAKQIKYFTYRTPGSSSEQFLDALIGRDDEKTERWYGAQKINTELAAISDVYMQYRHLGTFLSTSSSSPWFGFDGQYTDFDAIGEIVRPAGRDLLVGCFASDTAEHDRAIVCITTDDPSGKPKEMEFTMELTDAATATMYYKGTEIQLTPDENGYIHFTLDKGCGALITLGK